MDLIIYMFNIDLVISTELLDKFPNDPVSYYKKMILPHFNHVLVLKFDWEYCCWVVTPCFF